MSASRLEYLFNQSLLQRITAEEREELRLLLQDEKHVVVTDRLITAAFLNEKGDISLAEESSEQILESVLEVSRNAENVISRSSRVHFLKTTWLRYAAAAIILLAGAGTYLYLNKQPQKESGLSLAARSPDILPGGDKAVLTLSNGNTIVLDNAINGSLAQQGNTKIVKLTNGQLAYVAPGEDENPGGGNLVNAPEIYNTITTPRGGQYQVVLPDGSKIWLNAASSIRFPTAFTGHDRKVEISGEAYFEVVTNKKLPFIVSAGGTAVQVLGTSFNMNAYTDEPAQRTTLVDGSVRVVRDGHSTLLTPGQSVIINNEGDPAMQTENASVQEDIAWRNNQFKFNRADISSIMRQLSRWYGVDIIYEGTVLPRFTATVSRNVPVSEVLKALEYTGDVHFIIAGKKIIVKP